MKAKQPTWIWIVGVLLLVLVVCAWWFTPWAVQEWFGKCPEKTSGPFGDTFGAVNALFSGVAMVLLMIGVLIQHHEIQLLKDAQLNEKRIAIRKCWPLFQCTRDSDMGIGSVEFSFAVSNVGSLAVGCQIELLSDHGWDLQIRNAFSTDWQPGKEVNFTARRRCNPNMGYDGFNFYILFETVEGHSGGAILKFTRDEVFRVEHFQSDDKRETQIWSAHLPRPA